MASTISIPGSWMNEKGILRDERQRGRILRWYKEQDHRKSKAGNWPIWWPTAFVEGRLKLLVIRRKTHPRQHRVALVGDFWVKHEDAIQAFVSVKSRKKLTVIEFPQRLRGAN